MAEIREEPAEFIELTASDDGAKQPTFANHFNVHGAGDTVTLDLFYLAPDLEAGLFEKGAKDEEGVVRYTTQPVTRVVLPTRVALDLVAEMLEAVTGSAPLLKESFEEFGKRMGALGLLSSSPPSKEQSND